MKYTTFDKYDPDFFRRIQCVKNDPLDNIEITDNCFLLLIALSGSAVLTSGDEVIEIEAPCFACFDDNDAPVLVENHGLENYAVYFHPTFLNINMTVERLHDDSQMWLMCEHEMFLCRPFLWHYRETKIPLNYVALVRSSASDMRHELIEQRDGLWSCRARVCLIELMISLEHIIRSSQVFAQLDSDNFKSEIAVDRAVKFIESNYNKDITYEQIVKASGINKTDLAVLFKEKKGMTAFKYLMSFRIEIAKKQVTFTNVPIKDIATRNGFKNVQHFTRVFKDFTGESPAKYRVRTLRDRRAEFENIK